MSHNKYTTYRNIGNNSYCVSYVSPTGLSNDTHYSYLLIFLTSVDHSYWLPTTVLISQDSSWELPLATAHTRHSPEITVLTVVHSSKNSTQLTVLTTAHSTYSPQFNSSLRSGQSGMPSQSQDCWSGVPSLQVCCCCCCTSPDGGTTPAGSRGPPTPPSPPGDELMLLLLLVPDSALGNSECPVIR